MSNPWLIPPKKVSAAAKSCAQCGAFDDNPPGTRLKACGRCDAVEYCSRDCQTVHWKKGGHKKFCVPKEDRTPQLTQARSPRTHGSNGVACVICLEALDSGSATTLACAHTFHTACVDLLRAYGVQSVCPLCRAKLPSGNVPFQEEGDEAVHRYLLIQLRVGRGETTWQSLTKAERREMKEVVRLWRSAVDKGHAQSQYNLGVIYRHGQGVAQDLTETRRLYHLSAEQGCRDARMNLALMYQNGLGVASNDVEAYKWYLAAAEDGDAGACYSVGVYFDETSSWHGGVEKKDSAKAFEWYEKAALQGDSNAQHNLGYMLASGFGKKQDMVGAAKWLRLAADQGNDEAQFMLAQVYAGGQGGLEKSEEKAAKLYALSAKQGNFNAKMALKLLREPRSGSLTSAESIAQELVRAAMLSTKPPHSASLQVGSRVVLHSLTTRPELNGATGVVTSAKNESGRIGVQLDNGGKPFMLKNGNLDSIETKELLPLSAVAAKKADFDAASTAALETFPPHYLEMAWNTGADSGSLNTSMTGQKYPSIALLPPKLASMRVAFEKDCHDGWVKATATALVCADHSKLQCAQCSGWLQDKIKSAKWLTAISMFGYDAAQAAGTSPPWPGCPQTNVPAESLAAFPQNTGILEVAWSFGANAGASITSKTGLTYKSIPSLPSNVRSVRDSFESGCREKFKDLPCALHRKPSCSFCAALLVAEAMAGYDAAHMRENPGTQPRWRGEKN